MPLRRAVLCLQGLLLLLLVTLTLGQPLYPEIPDSIRLFTTMDLLDANFHNLGYAVFYIKGDKLASIVLNTNLDYAVTKISIECDRDSNGNDHAACIDDDIQVQNPLTGAPDWAGATMSPMAFTRITQGQAYLSISYSPEMVDAGRNQIPTFSQNIPNFYSILREQPQNCTNGNGTAIVNTLCKKDDSFTSPFNTSLTHPPGCVTEPGHPVPYCMSVDDTWGDCMTCRPTNAWGHLFITYTPASHDLTINRLSSFVNDIYNDESGIYPYPYTFTGTASLSMGGGKLEADVEDELYQGRFLAVMTSQTFTNHKLVAGPIVPMGFPEIDSVSTATNLSVELDFYDRGYDNATVAVAFNLPVRDVGNEIWIQFPQNYDIHEATVAGVLGVANPFTGVKYDFDNRIVKVMWNSSNGLLLVPYANYTVELHPKFNPLWQVTVYVDHVATPNNCDDTTFTVTTRKCFDEDLFDAHRYSVHRCPQGPTDVTITAPTPDGHPKDCRICNACKYQFKLPTGEDMYMCEHKGQTFMRTNVIQSNNGKPCVNPN